MVRVIMVKGVEYPVGVFSPVKDEADEQEHVTEYGVHWNFFFTLAMLPVFGMILWPIRRDYLRWSAIAVIIALGGFTLAFVADLPGHEICLSKAGLLRWVLSEAREGLIGMNKEGLVSLPGEYYHVMIADVQDTLPSIALACPPASIS
jgi:phosphatidylinositol glycan class W